MRSIFICNCLPAAAAVWLCAGVTFSENAMGPFDSARQEYAEYFMPGIVGRGVIRSQPAYIVCAVAERNFDAETDAELQSELTQTAKVLLLEYLSDGKPQVFDLVLTGFTPLYSWKQGRGIYGNFYVPETGVKLEKKTAATSPAEKTPHYTAAAQSNATNVSPFISALGEPRPDELRKVLDTLLETKHYSEAGSVLALVNPDISKSWGVFPDKIACHATIVRNVKLSESLVRLADIYFDETNYIAAATFYVRWLGINKETGNVDRETALYRSAFCAEKAGNNDGAVMLYEQMRKEFPFSERSARALSRIQKIQSLVNEKP